MHTDDIFRVTVNGIKVGKAYKDTSIERFSQKSEDKRTIDFWMEHRIYNDNNGYEVGYFRITSVIPNSDVPQYYYGRFHIRLRKENGFWKITQDWDISSINGIKITEEDFKKGTLSNLD